MNKTLNENLAMKVFTKYFMVCVVVCLVLSLTITVNAQYRVLHNFAGGVDDGSNPYNKLLLSDSTFYGMTRIGGVKNKGTIFKININGTGFQLMHSFDSASADGERPLGSLLLSGSTLYGMVASEGAGNGKIIKINTDGTGFQVLHSFSGSEGKWPYGDLVQFGSTLYGMNTYGGSSGGAGDINGNGTIFKINTDGSGIQVLHTFTGDANDGGGPHGSLYLSGSALYGSTLWGGTNNLGTIFKINTDWTDYRLLHTFTGSSNDGSRPGCTLVQSGSTLYGTADKGSNNMGVIFQIDTNGTGFQLLHNFTNAEGSPAATMILFGSTLYGTSGGGSDHLGKIFRVNTDGSGFQILYSGFSGIYESPCGPLFLSDSTLYGMTYNGGSYDLGVIFALDLRGTTGVHEEKTKGAINNFRLEQNYPNPFNPSTVISYQLLASSNVILMIYNLLGQKIKTFVNSFQSVGEHSLVWDATDESNNPVSSGIYFYRLEAGDRILQKKMVLVR